MRCPKVNCIRGFQIGCGTLRIVDRRMNEYEIWTLWWSSWGAIVSLPFGEQLSLELAQMEVATRRTSHPGARAGHNPTPVNEGIE